MTEENQTWITLHRKIVDWQWYNNLKTKSVFIHLLIKANHEDSFYRGVLVKRGQVCTGRKQLARELELTEQEIRTALNHLKQQEITIKTTNTYSIITINKYDSYQLSPKQSNQQNNQETTSKTTGEQPTDNHIQKPIQLKQSSKEGESAKRESKSGDPDPPKSPPLKNPGFSAEFMNRAWPHYLKAKAGKPYKNRESQEVALRQLYKWSGGDEQEAVEALAYAVANNYQGFQWYFRHKQKGGNRDAADTTQNGNPHAKANAAAIKALQRGDFAESPAGAGSRSG